MNFREWLTKLEHNQLNVGNTFDQGPFGDDKDGNDMPNTCSKMQSDGKPCKNDEIGQDVGSPADKIFGFRPPDPLLRLDVLSQNKKMKKKMSK